MSLTHNWSIRMCLHDGSCRGNAAKLLPQQHHQPFEVHRVLQNTFCHVETQSVAPDWRWCSWQWRWAPQGWRKALPITWCWVPRKLHKIFVLFSSCKRARSVCILLSERLFVVFNNTLYFPKNMVKIRILLSGLFFFFFCLPCKWWRLRLK